MDIDAIMDSIETKVHPLNKYLSSRVKDNKAFIPEREGTPNNIKLLTYNIQMIPKFFQDEKYNAGFSEERLTDIVSEFKNFDIICI